MFTKKQCYDDIKPMSCLDLNAKRNPIQPDSEVPVDSKSVCRSPLKWKFVELLLFVMYIDSVTVKIRKRDCMTNVYHSIAHTRPHHPPRSQDGVTPRAERTSSLNGRRATWAMSPLEILRQEGIWV